MFGSSLKTQLILLFSLFLLLFMGLTALFGTIYESHCTISANFTFIYSIFSKKFSVPVKNKRIPNRPLVYATEGLNKVHLALIVTALWSTST